MGRFVLATNDLALSPDTMLKYYKEQGTVERGFRFLKDKSFRVSEIYLKKKSRIQALAMIMVQCLFIYSISGGIPVETGTTKRERHRDQSDKETDQTADSEVDLFPVQEGKGIFQWLLMETG